MNVNAPSNSHDPGFCSSPIALIRLLVVIFALVLDGQDRHRIQCGFEPVKCQVAAGTKVDNTMTIYTDATKTSVDSSVTSNWSLESDTASTAYGCVNSTTRDANGVVIGTDAACFKIDTGGNVLGLRYTITVLGKTLVFR